MIHMFTFTFVGHELAVQSCSGRQLSKCDNFLFTEHVENAIQQTAFGAQTIIPLVAIAAVVYARKLRCYVLNSNQLLLTARPTKNRTLSAAGCSAGEQVTDAELELLLLLLPFFGAKNSLNGFHSSLEFAKNKGVKVTIQLPFPTVILLVL